MLWKGKIGVYFQYKRKLAILKLFLKYNRNNLSKFWMQYYFIFDKFMSYRKKM